MRRRSWPATSLRNRCRSTTSSSSCSSSRRPLFFLVADLVERLYYLKTALAALLIFIGAKLAAAEFVGKIGPEISLPVIAAILAAGVLASLWRTRRLTQLVPTTQET